MHEQLRNNIRLLMATNNIKTILELEEKSGVSRQVLDRLVNYKSKRLDYETVVRLCKALNCSIGELFYINDNYS